MGPTCPGANAGLARGCHRADPLDVELEDALGAVLDRHVGWQMHRGQMVDDLVAAVRGSLGRRRC
jgi:hypothetical protein